MVDLSRTVPVLQWYVHKRKKNRPGGFKFAPKIVPKARIKYFVLSFPRKAVFTLIGRLTVNFYHIHVVIQFSADKAEADAAAAAARVGTMSRGVLTKRDGTQTGVTSDTRTEFANHGSAVVFKGK